MMIIRATVIVFLPFLINCSLVDIEKYATGLNCSARRKSSKTYLVGSDKVNFFQAYFNCKSADMDLACLNSKQEDEDLAYILNSENRIGGFWISGTNLADISSSEYSWLTGGNRALYTNWLPDEPNNDGGQEHCIQYTERSGHIGWNDLPCQTKIRYICQGP